jgi:hypothetical protein
MFGQSCRAVVQSVDRFSGCRGSLVPEIGICADILHSDLEIKALTLTARVNVTRQWPDSVAETRFDFGKEPLSEILKSIL